MKTINQFLKKNPKTMWGNRAVRHSAAKGCDILKQTWDFDSDRLDPRFTWATYQVCELDYFLTSVSLSVLIFKMGSNTTSSQGCEE